MQRLRSASGGDWEGLVPATTDPPPVARRRHSNARGAPEPVERPMRADRPEQALGAHAGSGCNAACNGRQIGRTLSGRLQNVRTSGAEGCSGQERPLSSKFAPEL